MYTFVNITRAIMMLNKFTFAAMCIAPDAGGQDTTVSQAARVHGAETAAAAALES